MHKGDINAPSAILLDQIDRLGDGTPVSISSSTRTHPCLSHRDDGQRLRFGVIGHRRFSMKAIGASIP